MPLVIKANMANREIPVQLQTVPQPRSRTLLDFLQLPLTLDGTCPQVSLWFSHRSLRYQVMANPKGTWGRTHFQAETGPLERAEEGSLLHYHSVSVWAVMRPLKYPFLILHSKTHHVTTKRDPSCRRRRMLVVRRRVGFEQLQAKLPRSPAAGTNAAQNVRFWKALQNHIQCTFLQDWDVICSLA